MSGSSGMPTSLQLAPQFRNIGPSRRRDTLRPMNRRMFLGQAAMAYGAFLLHSRAQGTSHAPDLAIREIRAVRLRDGFNSRFIRVYTDQGLTGTGEMLDTVGAEYIINHNIGPSLAGRDPLEIEGILFDLWGWKHLSVGGSPSPLFMRGMGGPYLTAISGVEMALWDLAGKALNVPVYQLLGGRVRTRLPVYLHAANPAEATSLIAKTKVKALNSPLGTMAAAHVAAATPNLMLLEFTHYVDQSYTSLTEPVLLDGEGFLQVRTTPGIGVALNEDVVKERTDPEFHPL
jgi:L-alanine-DL-glutamate epimerase-like enolase superfamily enzyme